MVCDHDPEKAGIICSWKTPRHHRSARAIFFAATMKARPRSKSLKMLQIDSTYFKMHQNASKHNGIALKSRKSILPAFSHGFAIHSQQFSKTIWNRIFENVPKRFGHKCLKIIDYTGGGLSIFLRPKQTRNGIYIYIYI